jgi:hypothetical protein
MTLRLFVTILTFSLFSSISMNAVAACDFTGNWKNVTAGGTFQLTQVGNIISFSYFNSGFNHYGNAIYNPDDDTFVIRQNRVTKATNCKTQSNLTYKVLSCDKLVMTAVWDGGCGIPSGYTEGPYTMVRG